MSYLEISEEETDDELTGSSEALNTKEKGGIFSGIFKKTPKSAEAAQPEEDESPDSDLSASTEHLFGNKQEKGGKLFGVLLKKTPKASGEKTESPEGEAEKELFASSDDLSENNTPKEKNIFSNMFKKPQKPAEGAAADKDELLDSDLSASTENLSGNKQEGEANKELCASNDDLSENNTPKEKNIFSNMFKKPQKPAEGAAADKDELLDSDLSASTENLCGNKQEKGGKLFGVLLKKTPKASGERAETLEGEAEKELSASNDDLSENNTPKEKNIFSNMFKKPQKPAEGAAADKELEVNTEKLLSGSCENLEDTPAPKEKKGGLAGIFKRSGSIDNLFDEEKGGLFGGLLKKPPKVSGDEATAEDKEDQKELSASNDSLFENSNTKEKNIFSGMFKKTPKPSEGTTTDEELIEDTTLSDSYGGLAGIFKKSPKPSPRLLAAKDPLKDTSDLYGSCDSLPGYGEGDLSALGELSNSNDNLIETTKEKKGGFAGIFRRTPKTIENRYDVIGTDRHQIHDSEDLEAPTGGIGLRRRKTIKKKKEVKTTRPKMSKLNLTLQGSDKMADIQEVVEMQDLNPAQDSTVDVQNVEMAAYPTGENPLETEPESDELTLWWNTVKGWAEWNENSNLQEEDEEMMMEQAADRVYMAARLFVRLFNKRGASLQHRILELMALADAADEFHKKTVQAAVGGGVASVAGSIATITGLILAPFTMGASIIVTAVGIAVATAGSITSATANITDTVHSNMDRKNLEKMIQGYQEEIKDIRECMEFVQAGMATLQEWDFEKYSQSAAKKAMNHNLKHVMKEGGRAGKALMINTDKLISTVQVLGVAGGAAKAAQAISVTTGVMSGLFLALDVFFLAKDSHELRKGAKTKFATKIRDVCKELQDGLLDLNKVKTQLQKTMDGIEVEEFEEIVEVEEEVDDEFESDPKKLAELEQELDLMEEKLDKKVEEQKKIKEVEKESVNKEKKEEKSVSEKGEGIKNKEEIERK
ncbi:Apolipoprotein L3 [Dissostichus eleginoides]|uniref:Apolipoprotein L3 n=1 Tax=Dissostichus eleginoides TaxID=100907 RepID=A0AAD9ESA2_DISEL|nr:Apolipoprotein L3 [Dissostichus eleginoides]